MLFVQKIEDVDTDSPRCTGIKLMLDNHCDVMIVCVYMPFLNSTMEQKIEYESTVGCLQGIMDRNLGCDFVIGGDFNVAKTQSNANVAALENLCSSNGIVWLDPASSNINYTYADTNGYYSLIDHMLVSPQLVDDQRSVVIHVDDYNASDHYAISIGLSMTLPSAHARNDTSTKCKTLKYLWDNADIHGYANVLREQLSRVVLPKEALMCNGSCEKGCVEAIDRYYNNIVQCLITASNSCIPIKNSKYKKTLVE